MPLKTKSIKQPKAENDGLRISVMSRHTLNDGKTPDPDMLLGITFEEWWPTLGPPAHLIGAYYKRGLIWEEFETKFNFYLEQALANEKLRELIALALQETVTILCVEKSPQQCHRRLIAEAAKKIDPDLKVIIE